LPFALVVAPALAAIALASSLSAGFGAFGLIVAFTVAALATFVRARARGMTIQPSCALAAISRHRVVRRDGCGSGHDGVRLRRRDGELQLTARRVRAIVMASGTPVREDVTHGLVERAGSDGRDA
jgi:hypothetical protein